MSKSVLSRVASAAGALILAALGTVNSGLIPRRVSAFTTLTVMNTADSGSGSLRDTIAAANPGDTIGFGLTLPATITLTSGQIMINKDLTVAGPGANLLTISGNSSSRIFAIPSGQDVSISGITFANGVASFGGAIFNQGTLSATFSTFNGNFGTSAGAILNEGALSVANDTFTSNFTDSLFNGGAIENTGGTLSATNCTFSGNSANGGGAIAGDSTGGSVAVTNCTFSGNSGFGTGIFIESSTTTLSLVNTIIAGTGTGCTGMGTITTNSHNLIQDGSCSPMLTGDPKLGPLQGNGGPTQTFALLSGSPAIDAGDDSVLGPPLSLTTDQRGSTFPRLSGPHVDIGAFELQVPVGPSFDTCLKDNTTGNLLQWNSTTGQYMFTRCSDAFTLTGTGTVGLVNGIKTLTDFKSDRRISAGFNTGQLTGNATIYLQVAQGVWQTFRVFDTNPSAVCKC